MSRIFSTKSFSHWMRKNDIVDASLVKAVGEMEAGLIDAELGGSLYKKRISLSGMGKRGGARTIIATLFKEKWFFLYGFNKNEKASISAKEKRTLTKLAEQFLRYSDEELNKVIQKNIIREVIP